MNKSQPPVPHSRPQSRDISLPQGVRDILPEEAEIVGNAEKTILATFEKHGFHRFIPPLVEYTDVLSRGVGPDLRDKVFTFTEPTTGRSVAITPDITPQVARVIATRMRDVPLPLKLCYNKNVLRIKESEGGAFREILQIGAEHLTGEGSTESDVEIIATAIEILKALDMDDFTIDIGTTRFVRTIIEQLSVDDNEKERIRDAIALKDVTALEKIVAACGKEIGNEAGALLLRIPTLFGDNRVVDEALAFVSGGETRAALEQLGGVVEALRGKGYGKHLTIDLGEVRCFEYYTGVIFEAFAHGVGKAILSGGRYDTLMAHYGYPCSAIGFAFDMENLVNAIEKRG